MINKEEQLALIRNSIKLVLNYPNPGIVFYDITGLLENPQAYAACIAILVNQYQCKRITKIVSTESRGFLFGAPLALSLKKGFILIRKSGKLPRDTIKEQYVMEYGVNSLEIHKDAVSPGDNVLAVDDVLATGGTIKATVKLIRRLGGNIQDAAFIINLKNLDGEKALNRIGVNGYSLLQFYC